MEAWVWLTVAAAGVAALYFLPAQRLATPLVWTTFGVGFAVDARHSGEAIDGGQWTAATVSFAVAVIALVYEAAKAPRKATVRPWIRPVRLSWRSASLVTVATAAAVVSLEWPRLRSWLLPDLAVLLLMAFARETSKTTFRLAAAVAAVVAVVAIGFVGATAREDEAEDEALEELAAVGDALEDVREQLAARLAACPDDTLPCEELSDLDRQLDDVTLPEATEREVRDGEPEPELSRPIAARREIAQARIDLRLVAVGLAQLDDEQTEVDVTATLTEARAELTEARATLEGLPSPPVATEVVDLLEAGVDEILASRLAGLMGGEIEPALGVVGWIVLVLALVIGYRELEILNNQRYGTPVDVAEVVGGTEGLAAVHTQRLRERIRSVGLTEPAAVPLGTTVTKELSSVLEADSIPQGKIVGALFRFFQVAAFPPAGVTLRTAVTALGSAEKEGGDTHEASIELTTRVAERYVSSGTVRAPSELLLVDRVADFVAADAACFAAGVPAWAKWQDRDGRALGLFRRATEELAGPEHDDDRLRTLREAHALSPANASVRMSLAHQYELAAAAPDQAPQRHGCLGSTPRWPDGTEPWLPRRIDALRLHLETAIDYPTMLTCRYRLATSMLMLGDDAHLTMRLAAYGDRAGLEHLLRRRYGKEAQGFATQPVGEQRALLRKWAVAELGWLRRRVNPAWLLWAALRPSEREHWLRLVRDGVARRRQLSTYKTVRLAGWLGQTDEPERIDDLVEKLEKAAPENNDTSPAAHYNAARFHCRLITTKHTPGEGQPTHAEAALVHLTEALRRGGPQLFKREWIMADPDLDPIRADQRFTALVEHFFVTPTTKAHTPAPAEDEPTTIRAAWSRFVMAVKHQLARSAYEDAATAAPGDDEQPAVARGSEG